MNRDTIRPGNNNSITDVSGVSLGHITLSDGPIQTGVTAILPHQEDLFLEKVPAACHVINGFGKSTGLLQIEEMGCIETPLVLTNTLSVGTAYDGVVRYMLSTNPELGRDTGTVNPVICECNDGYLNDIRGLHVTGAQVQHAIQEAKKNYGNPIASGAVGAGRGMSCYGMKGGIGTASRQIFLSSATFTLGALVMTNFGKMEDFTLHGDPLGKRIAEKVPSVGPDKGSVIIILAVDAPLSPRQLGRLSRRAVSGLARTGAYIASGSGEIVIAFSTLNRISHKPEEETTGVNLLHEEYLDLFLQAATESVENAVIDSLLSAVTVTGRDNHIRYSLRELLDTYIPNYTGAGKAAVL